MERVLLALCICLGSAGFSWGQEMPTVMVRLISPDGVSVTIEAEVAETPGHRARGLMYRPVVPAGTGMLFLWSQAVPVVMWMKNTPVSLDMLFIHEHKVAGVIEQTRPFSEAPLSAGKAVDAVLEVKAGTVAEYDIKVGWRVEWTTPVQNP
jgi:hypothetical protein